jgi:hypothetical protein
MRRPLLLLSLAGAAALAAAPTASADVALSGGATTLKLSKPTAKALKSLGVKVAPTGRAKAVKGGVRFPITGGHINPATAAGRIDHRGGLRLSAGGTRVVLKDYRVSVGKRITLSAKVGKARVTILRLTGKAKVKRSGFNTNVSGLKAGLTRAAAKALNGAFHVKAFKKGLRLGSVTVRSKTSQTELAAKGGTALAIDPGTLSALTSLGITPNVIAPATLSGTTATFPITGGVADLDLGGGVVRHSGGISLTKGSTVVTLTDFDVKLGAAPQLFATLNGAGAKVAAIDLDLSAATPSVSGRDITVSGVVAKLTQGAADALNQAFSTTAFSGGLVLGQVTVTATGR